MEELFIFLFGPFGLFDGWIKPFVPSGFALFWGFAHQEGRDAGPLILAVFGDGSLEDLVFGVLPNTTFDDDANHDGQEGLGRSWLESESKPVRWVADGSSSDCA